MRHTTTLLLASAVMATTTVLAGPPIPTWTHLSSKAGEIPEPNVARQVSALIFDVDGDRVNDFVIAGWGKQEGAVKIEWYQRRADGWQKYLVDPDVQYVEAGGDFADIDGDGDFDFAIGGDWRTLKEVWWWENPSPNFVPGVPWKRHLIKNSDEGGKSHHDILLGDFDSDGQTDAVFWNQKAFKLFFAKGPRDPRNTEPWELTLVHQFPVQEEGKYEGLAKADVDLDQRMDFVGGGHWFKSDGQGGFTVMDVDPDYFATRSGVGDLIEGGWPEIVLAPGDIDGPLNLYQHVDGAWQKTTLIDHVIHGHSLQIADINADGHLDIYSGEMGLWHNGSNEHCKSRILYGDGQGNFTHTEIPGSEGLGNHENKLGDLDGDGDLDLLQKPFMDDIPRLDIWLNDRVKSVPSSAMIQKPSPDALPLDRWTYIEVDNARTKYGDYADPKWMRYFGIAAGDLSGHGNGYQDIVSGRYFYRNPGGDMTGAWERTDFGANVDACLVLDVDGDEFGDVIAMEFPAIYWIEATDKQATGWDLREVAEAPKTKHANSQGFTTGQIVAGGKPEIVFATESGVFYYEIPDQPEAGNWPRTLITLDASDEGLDLADIDGDGRVDLVAGKVEEYLAWWRNPGDGTGKWQRYIVGTTAPNPVDRVKARDLNGDGRIDIAVTEERYPGKEPDANLYWFEQPADPTAGEWTRHRLITTWSLNNLDAADIDQDGDIDLVTSEHKGPSPTLYLFENDGLGHFAPRVLDNGHESHLGTQLADLDGDGDLDLMSIAWDNYKFLHLWRNNAR